MVTFVDINISAESAARDNSGQPVPVAENNNSVRKPIKTSKWNNWKNKKREKEERESSPFTDYETTEPSIVSIDNLKVFCHNKVDASISFFNISIKYSFRDVQFKLI